MELSRRGFSVPTIASTVGIGRPAVELILEMAREVEEEAEAAGEGGG